MISMFPLPALISRVAIRWLVALSIAVAVAAPARADEAAIRKAIAERITHWPKLDEVTKTAIPGLFEIRIGTDLFYTDATGTYLIQGSLIDTRTRENLTEARIARLTAIDFKTLPLKDAIVWKQGSGARKLVVFADPNCGYCKTFERELLAVKDVTVYTFLYPILGPDSTEKSKAIWCAKDKTASWRDWMLKGVFAAGAQASCDDSALQRNLALGRRYKINGTPAVVFEDGTKKPGALSADAVEKQLAASRSK